MMTENIEKTLKDDKVWQPEDFTTVNVSAYAPREKVEGSLKYTRSDIAYSWIMDIKEFPKVSDSLNYAIHVDTYIFMIRLAMKAPRRQNLDGGTEPAHYVVDQFSLPKTVQKTSQVTSKGFFGFGKKTEKVVEEVEIQRTGNPSPVLYVNYGWIKENEHVLFAAFRAYNKDVYKEIPSELATNSSSLQEEWQQYLQRRENVKKHKKECIERRDQGEEITGKEYNSVVDYLPSHYGYAEENDAFSRLMQAEYSDRLGLNYRIDFEKDFEILARFSDFLKAYPYIEKTVTKPGMPLVKILYIEKESLNAHISTFQSSDGIDRTVPLSVYNEQKESGTNDDTSGFFSSENVTVEHDEPTFFKTQTAERGPEMFDQDDQGDAGEEDGLDF